MTGGVHAPALVAALRYVASHQGCNLLRVAEHVGPFTGRRFDYDLVNRALDLALIQHRPDPEDERGTGAYRLHLTPDGWAVLNAGNGLPAAPAGGRLADA